MDDEIKNTGVMVTAEIICSRCLSRARIIPGIHIGGMTEADRWTAIAEEITNNPLGWAIEEDSDHRRSATCDQCNQKLINIDNGLIDKFSIFTRCPACRCFKCSSVYMSGSVAPSLLPVPHIVRTCRRCGFKFPQLTHE